MKTTGVLINLLTKDLRTVYRDRFMLIMVVLPLAATGGLRGLLYFGSRLVSVPDLALYFAPLAILLAPLTLGSVAGFGLIEERSKRTWLSLRVMPLSLGIHVLYQSGFAAALSTAVSIPAILIYGVRPSSWPFLLLMTVVTSVSAGLIAFLLGSLASNQIEGMAVSKTLGAVMATPLAAFVLAPRWQLLVSWSPWYWGYLGLVRAFAGPGIGAGTGVGGEAGQGAVLAGLIQWPGYPLWLMVGATLLLGVAGTLVFARVYGRSAG